jgi:type I restriction enzyme M protein
LEGSKFKVGTLGTGIMPPKKTTKAKKKNGNGVNLGIENELWEAADKLRGHLDAAESRNF